MAQAHATATITTPHVLIRSALDDLERAMPTPTPGQQVALESPHWRDVFVMTRHHGWLRVPN